MALVSNSFWDGDCMMFRKNTLLFYQSEIFYFVMAILCLALFPMLGLGLSLLYVFPFAVLMLVNPKLHNEFITINEIGISCQRSGIQLWAYEWDTIAGLKRSSRFLMPSIEVIPYNKCGEPEQFAMSNHYFQLGRAARKAVKRYYKPAENT